MKYLTESITDENAIFLLDLFRYFLPFNGDGVHTGSRRSKICRSLQRVLYHGKPDARFYYDFAETGTDVNFMTEQQCQTETK